MTYKQEDLDKYGFQPNWYKEFNAKRPQSNAGWGYGGRTKEQLDDSQFGSITEEELKKWQEDANELNALYSVLRGTANTEFHLAKKAFLEELKPGSKEYKYVSAIYCPAFYPYTPDIKNVVLTPLQNWKDNKAKEIKAKDNEKKLDELNSRAILYCQSKGKVLGTDFTVSNAMDLAHEIKYEELIEAHEGYIDFGGDDYCENCKGWDGKSHRCDCGNRRMSWTSEGNFEDMYIYGEAY